MPPGSRKPPRGGEISIDGRPASWVLDGEVGARPLVVLAHGAGAPLTSPFMDAVARGLAGRDTAVVRFHFPYMERNAREARRGAPDRPPVLLATFRAVLDLVRGWGPFPIVLAGKSMGGRIASLLLAEGTPPHVWGAVYLGYPLSPAGRPAVVRAEHLGAVAVPQLFVSGTRDSLCDLAVLRRVLVALGPSARLHVVDGGDHSLATSRKEPLAGSDAWLQVVAEFVHECARRRP